MNKLSDKAVFLRICQLLLEKLSNITISNIVNI